MALFELLNLHHYTDSIAPDGRPDESALTAEAAKLEKEIEAKSRELEALQRDLNTLKDIRYFVREFMPELATDENTTVREPVSVREQLMRNRRMLQEQQKEARARNPQDTRTERKPEL